MEIVSEQLGERLILQAAGRLDSHWADHLTRELDEWVRKGQHRITLDLAGIVFISSMGIRVLLSFQRKLKGLDGSFGIQNPSDPVREVLELAGIMKMFAPREEPATAKAASQELHYSTASTRFEVFALGGAGMACRAQGRPDRLDGCQFTAVDCERVALPATTVALGLGALGNDFEECRDSFGEFFAVAGTAVCLPGNGSNQCDFLVAEGGYVPEVQSLYSLVCEGRFSHLVRFDSLDANHPTSLSELAEAALKLTGAASVCIAIAAESAGLIGASLRRSPATRADASAPYGFPAMREWLSFSTERLDAGSMVIAAGVVTDATRSPEALQPFVRALGVAGSPNGHVHAAPFRFKPLPQGLIDLQRTIKPFFDGESAQGVLHLLCDDRDADKPEESRFLRGACWIAPLTLGT